MSIWIILMVSAIVVFVVIPSFKDREFPIKKIMIPPIVLSFFLYKTTTTKFLLNTSNLSLLILGVTLGVMTGILIRRKTPIKVNRAQKSIWMPGGYFILMAFICIFSANFAVGYLHSTNPFILQSINAIQHSLLFLLGFSSSVMIGGSLCLIYRYLTEEVKIA